jgi:hypothetical protein
LHFLTADTGLEDNKIEPSGVAPIGDDSLLLVENNRYHDNTLWFESDEKISASRPAELPPDKLKLADLRLVEPQKVWLFGLDGKAEGMPVLSEEAASSQSQARRARVALVYDNDTAKTGELGLVQFITLLEWPE